MRIPQPLLLLFNKTVAEKPLQVGRIGPAIINKTRFVPPKIILLAPEKSMKKETEFLGNRKLIWHGRKRNANRRAGARFEISQSKLQMESENKPGETENAPR
jgi:hypothetical protein